MSLTIGSLWEKDSKNTKANDTIANIPKGICYVIKNNSFTRCMKFKLMYLLKLISSHSKQIKKATLWHFISVSSRVYSIQTTNQFIHSYVYPISQDGIELNFHKTILIHF